MYAYRNKSRDLNVQVLELFKKFMPVIMLAKVKH